MYDIILEILRSSYWEHFKRLKDMSLIYDIDHPKIIELKEEVDKIQEKINEHAILNNDEN